MTDQPGEVGHPFIDGLAPRFEQVAHIFFGSDESKRLTLAPLQWGWDAEVADRFDFNSVLSLRRLPPGAGGPGIWAPWDLYPVRLEYTFAFFLAHSRETLEQSRSDLLYEIGRQSTRTLELCEFAMWLQRPSFAVHVKSVTVGPNSILTNPRFRDAWIQGHPDDLQDPGRYSASDLEVAARLLGVLNSIPETSPLWPGIESTMLALKQNQWGTRLLLLWIAMESLFAPQQPNEATFRLAQRAAVFLCPNRTAARQKDAEIREAYRIRSDIVHGGRRRRGTPVTRSERMQAVRQVETWVRESYRRLLVDPVRLDAFSDPERHEQVLEGLIWKDAR